MNNDFTAIIQSLVAEQGKEALFNAAKCKALLADYTRGDYKKESRLLLQAIEAGIAEALSNAGDIDSCKAQAIRKLQDEYFLAENIAADLVDMLLSVLSLTAPKPQEAAAKTSPKTKTEPRTLSTARAVTPEPAAIPVPAGKLTKKKKILIAIAVFIGLVIVSQILLVFRANYHFDNAWREQNDDAAIKEFTDCINLYRLTLFAGSGLSQRYRYRGSTYKMKGDFYRAIEDYNKAIEHDPRNNWPYALRGEVYLLNNEYERAIQDCNKAIELYPNTSYAYAIRGNAYYMKGEYDNAIQDCSKAIEHDPQYAYAYASRGNAYYMEGDYDRAIQDLDKAISLDPNYPWAKDRLPEAKQARGW